MMIMALKRENYGEKIGFVGNTKIINRVVF